MTGLLPTTLLSFNSRQSGSGCVFMSPRPKAFSTQPLLVSAGTISEVSTRYLLCPRCPQWERHQAKKRLARRIAVNTAKLPELLPGRQA
jgi:hypothetical protein